MIDFDLLRAVVADMPSGQALLGALCILWFVLFAIDPREALFRTKQLALVFDQVLNVVGGSGWADEVYSAYAHRRQSWHRRVVNALFFWQPDHCRSAYQSELARRHLPPEYRNNLRSDQ